MITRDGKAEENPALGIQRRTAHQVAQTSRALGLDRRTLDMCDQCSDTGVPVTRTQTDDGPLWLCGTCRARDHPGTRAETAPDHHLAPPRADRPPQRGRGASIPQREGNTTMGTGIRGPVPKRSDQRRRVNEPVIPVETSPPPGSHTAGPPRRPTGTRSPAAGGTRWPSPGRAPGTSPPTGSTPTSGRTCCPGNCRRKSRPR